jgi:hypothetical protein
LRVSSLCIKNAPSANGCHIAPGDLPGGSFCGYYTPAGPGTQTVCGKLDSTPALSVDRGDMHGKI